MKKKGLYRKLSMSELKNIFGGEMLDDQGRKIVRKNLDGVYSIKGGIVVKVYYAKDSNEKGYGNYILVKDQKNGVIVRYAHLDKINVKKGQMVNKEDEIGIMGNSGTDKSIYMFRYIKIVREMILWNMQLQILQWIRVEK